MNRSNVELGCALVACPKWTWLPGTQPARQRLHGDWTPHQCLRVPSDGVSEFFNEMGWIPWLDDVLTYHSVLAVVRLAWPDRVVEAPRKFAMFDPECGYGVRIYDERDGMVTLFQGDTEIEALLAALQAAP